MPQTNGMAFCVLALMYLVLLLPGVIAARQAHQAVVSWGGFHSTWATRFAMLGALGFLGVLGFNPGSERLFGFMGFFGLIGAAYIAEIIARLRSRPTSPGN